MAADDLPVLELIFRGPLRDSGVAAVLEGEKTAQTGLPQIYEHDGEPVPEPAQSFSMIDSEGRSAAVIELTGARVVPISVVDDDYARAEGREEFFCSEGGTECLRVSAIDDETLEVTWRFRLVKPGDIEGS